MSSEREIKELEAKRKRAEALKYLDQQGQTVDNSTPTMKAKTQTDNTLELLFKQKALQLNSSGEPSLEQKLKCSLLDAQEKVRTVCAPSSEHFITVTSSENQAKTEPVNSKDWQSVFDAESGRHYFWNVKTNETSWERPTCVVEIEETSMNETYAETVKHETTKQQGDWIESIHHASQQKYWVHKGTGEKRFSPPSSTASVTTGSEAAATKISREKEQKRAQPDLKRRRVVNIDPLGK